MVHANNKTAPSSPRRDPVCISDVLRAQRSQELAHFLLTFWRTLPPRFARAAEGGNGLPVA